MKLIRGFSFVEIMVVVAVLLLLGAIAAISFQSLNERLLLRQAASDLAFHLEEAKAASVAGEGAAPHGVHFEADRYVVFTGEEYDVDDGANVTHLLDGRLSLDADIIDGEDSIVFHRITGAASNAATITVMTVGGDRSRTVVVGGGGDVSYGE